MLRRNKSKSKAEGPKPFVPFLAPDRKPLPASAWGTESAKVWSK